MFKLIKKLIPRWAYPYTRGIYRFNATVIRKVFGIVARSAHIVGFYLTRTNESCVPRIGMHTIFIAKENVLFLEEWILYHKSLGVEYFFLYDNSAVKLIPPSHADAGAVAGQIAKRNVPYGTIVTMTEDGIQEELDRLQQEIPNVFIYEWSPVNRDGQIWHGKIECQRVARKNHKHLVNWMLFMDVDEFLVSSEDLSELCARMVRQGYGGCRFIERPMDHRFRHMDKQTCEIDLECPYYNHLDRKILCYLPRTWYTETHKFKSSTVQKNLRGEEMHYRHFKHHSTDDVNLVRIDPLNFNDARDSDWKLDHISPDWRQIMDSTRTTDHLIGKR